MQHLWPIHEPAPRPAEPRSVARTLAVPHGRAVAWPVVLVSYALAAAGTLALASCGHPLSTPEVLLRAHLGPLAALGHAGVGADAVFGLAAWVATGAAVVTGCVARPSWIWLLPLTPILFTWMAAGVAFASRGC